MPKRFPGWAESGARLGLDLQVKFTDIPSSVGESLVGPKSETFQLQVTPPSLTFVTERGEETVDFAATGGWCIQRPTGNVRNANGSVVKPEGLLRFWLDCTSGARRKDVEIFPNTRIFFTTGVWDDPVLLDRQEQDYRIVLDQLEETVRTTRAIRKESKENNMLQNLSSFFDLAENSREYDTLKAKKEEYEGGLPPVGSCVASNGVQLAPTGSLVIKGNDTPDWLPGSEYLILGTFSTAGT
eukprot:CAMPEP_0194253148 /NCGR_PEP_ID=MMETSP0158-20130606/29306_1 /TAXON_ID=33649 /ORGANISM="Thalassionema nitzschioides, Strain L26-B" /LENGTH=240 /DNA_ID=CAMNT_0038990765 /DNA_START=233 /DNA_END=955 /DNA_ORIENTATION=+